ncbi:MAG: ABC-F family ATP-binding cassette domain-containing protein [Ruminococcus sp.]|nr:ABC-F family ATP-binding cassette domain-containing protein [Ruminococcus sp.]
MSIVSVQKLSMSFGERELFSDVSFEIEAKDKIGFIGNNGVGKTTLFRILCGELSPASGTVATEKNLKVGYMEQHACTHMERTIYEELLSVFSYLEEMEQKITEITRSIDEKQGDLHALVDEQTRLIDEFEREGGLTYQSRTKAALLGLGFSSEDFSLSVSALSGGQRSKLSLAKLLLSKSSLLLLDEPTNHLDIASVSWLEVFLKDYKGAMIIISHDRYFLDAVTNKTIELEHGKVMCYKGNYTEFKKKKQAILEAQKNKYENDIREIKRIEGIIEQQKRWNREKNLVTAHSKEKERDRIVAQLVKPDSELSSIRFRFEVESNSGNEVLDCQNLSKSFGSNHLFSHLSFHLQKGERVFILGENGCGKTTLFKILTREGVADAGEITFGAGVEVGYFDQMQENLNLNNTALDEVWNTYPRKSETTIRSALAAFLFKGDEVYKPLYECSGGERARISLLKLMLKGSNLLLLDEPTNHLDASSREALEETLLNYEGTLLVISHDRYFINKLASRVLVMSETGVKEYLGNYDYYAEHIEEASPSPETKEKKEKPKNDYQLRKEAASNERKRQTRLKRAEDEIERLENAIAITQDELSKDETVSDYEKLIALTAQLEELQAALEEQYLIWEENSI